jgi:transcriptional regulator with XRE-family HTH domain
MAKHYRTLTEYLDNGPETQQQLAARIGMSQGTISLAKSGKGSYRTLKLIADATGVPLDSFGRPQDVNRRSGRDRRTGKDRRAA